MSREKTPEESKQEFLKLVREYAEEWARVPNKTVEERLHGLVFSILVIFDGEAVGFPAVDLVLRPHPDDKEYHKEHGENWHRSGLILNEVRMFGRCLKFKEKRAKKS